MPSHRKRDSVGIGTRFIEAESRRIFPFIHQRITTIVRPDAPCFDGTLIVVSHDRDFLDGLVSKVYEFGHGRVREHLCGIYEFLESKKMESLQELEKK